MNESDVLELDKRGGFTGNSFVGTLHKPCMLHATKANSRTSSLPSMHASGEADKGLHISANGSVCEQPTSAKAARIP